jgi:hypothetical protein
LILVAADTASRISGTLSRGSVARVLPFVRGEHLCRGAETMQEERELSRSEIQAGGHHEVGESGDEDQRRDAAEVDNE